MRAKISKPSTNELRVSFSEPSTIDSGIIELYAYLKKGNSEKIAELPYDKEELSYVFNLEDQLPRNIGDLDFQIIVKNDSQSEESRRLRLYGDAPHHLSGVLKKVRYDFDIVSRRYNGSIAYFFKKLPGTKKCSECWDEDLQSSNNSNCKACGGDGYITTYSKPYKTVCGPMLWQDEAYVVDSPGKTIADPTVKVSALGDLPLVTDDIIYYVKTGDFLRVARRMVSETQSSIVLQSFFAKIIPSDTPEATICMNRLKDEGIIK